MRRARSEAQPVRTQPMLARRRGGPASRHPPPPGGNWSAAWPRFLSSLLEVTAGRGGGVAAARTGSFAAWGRCGRSLNAVWCAAARNAACPPQGQRYTDRVEFIAPVLGAVCVRAPHAGAMNAGLGDESSKGKHMTRLQQLASILAGIGLSGPALSQEFTLLSQTTGLSNAHSYEVSSDGTVVAGTGNGVEPIGLTGWWWTQATGTQLVPPLAPNYPKVVVDGMSADGGVLVGGCYPVGAAGSLAFITDRGGVPQALPMPAGFEFSTALGLSDDGRVACGQVIHVRSQTPGDTLQVAAVWRQGGVVAIGVPPGWTASGAWDVTDTGLVVGSLWDAVGQRNAAFQWTEQSGFVVLQGPPGRERCQAARVSPDGRVITGTCRLTAGGFPHATRWVDGGPGEDLGALPGYYSEGVGLSPDGRLIVGYCHGQIEGRAFLYSDSIGMVDLRSFLISRGIEVPVNLKECADITPDGSTLVGTASPTPGTAAAWLARVPMLGCSADCDLNGSLDVSDFICFLNLYARRSRDADCNGDGVLAAADFLCFLDRHAAGCN